MTPRCCSPSPAWCPGRRSSGVCRCCCSSSPRSRTPTRSRRARSAQAALAGVSWSGRVSDEWACWPSRPARPSFVGSGTSLLALFRTNNCGGVAGFSESLPRSSWCRRVPSRSREECPYDRLRAAPYRERRSGSHRPGNQNLPLRHGNMVLSGLCGSRRVGTRRPLDLDDDLPPHATVVQSSVGPGDVREREHAVDLRLDRTTHDQAAQLGEQ